MRLLHVFGGPHLTYEGARREIPEGSKRLVVFAALQRRRVERRYAAGMLWPECSDARAAGNLRSALWRLRGADIDVLDVDKWSIEVRDDVLVDSREVVDWASRLADGTAEAADLRVPSVWVEALNLLPGWYDDWILTERERMRQTVMHALEALSVRLVAAQRCPEAVDAALLAVCAEPLRESAQRRLIEAHLAEGNLVEARRSYDLYRGLLSRELGVEPTQAIARLVATIPSQRTPGQHSAAPAALLGEEVTADR
jgi:DNA-binding SARP family transcriptional activator